jgi:hypothetical protein
MSKKSFDSFSDELNHYRHKGGAPKRCYETHPALDLGGDLKVYGGSCITPSVPDADIYIGFDSGMRLTPDSFPWNPGGKIEVLFYVADGAAPRNVTEFKKMVVWAAEQIRAGKKLHAGCIGGHGRTGTFLAALVRYMIGTEDAITYVRENYCHRAVESAEQVNFLHEHYGIKKIGGSKAHLYGGDYHGGEYYGEHKHSSSWGKSSALTANTQSARQVPKSKGSLGSSGSSLSKKTPAPLSSAAKQIHPVESARNIWATV